MTEFSKETILTTSDEVEASKSQKIEYYIYLFFGALEILLAFRLVLKFLGASLSSSFVSSIYAFTRIFILPFEGIFRRGITQGIETTSVLEPATIVALIVYSILAWGIVQFVRVFSGNKQDS